MIFKTNKCSHQCLLQILVYEKFALTGKASLPHMLEDYLIKLVYILNNDSMAFLFGIFYLGINTLKISTCWKQK
jgi:hypothetical protein